MKKIGIVTHYYNSTNYGGSLQAYALCKALQDLGYEAKQLQIDHTEDCYDLTDTSALAPVKRLIGKPTKRLIKRALLAVKPQQRRQEALRLQKRQQLLQAFSSFNQNLTPHSDLFYTEKTIQKTLDEYDAFITGSDQVWNPNWFFKPFFLSFVPSGVTKLSYAASISHPTLTPPVKEAFRDLLKDFTAVSVREEDAVSLLQDVAPQPVQCVLDPTLLLSKEDWAQVAAAPQLQEQYVFCYFLGDDPKVRQIAAQYAKDHNLKLLTIPHAAGIPHQNDYGFGDIQMECPSVEEFLSLIRNATYVFTDSFHASVFSLIFQRQFAVFARAGHKHMGSRLYHLTNLFDIPQRFCDSSEKTDTAYIEALPPIDYNASFPNFQASKTSSLAFLRDHLN